MSSGLWLTLASVPSNQAIRNKAIVAREIVVAFGGALVHLLCQGDFAQHRPGTKGSSHSFRDTWSPCPDTHPQKGLALSELNKSNVISPSHFSPFARISVQTSVSVQGAT